MPILLLPEYITDKIHNKSDILTGYNNLITKHAIIRQQIQNIVIIRCVNMCICCPLKSIQENEQGISYDVKQ